MALITVAKATISLPGQLALASYLWKGIGQDIWRCYHFN